MPAAEKNILLVDDDPITANIAARIFKTRQPNVNLTFTSDGIAACQYIQGTGQYANRCAYPIPGVILLDLNMPQLTGLEFLRWLRDQAPNESRNVPVVIVSSSCSTAELALARALGTTHFFRKPFRWSDLCQTIESEGLLSHTATMQLRPSELPPRP